MNDVRTYMVDIWLSFKKIPLSNVYVLSFEVYSGEIREKNYPEYTRTYEYF